MTTADPPSGKKGGGAAKPVGEGVQQDLSAINGDKSREAVASLRGYVYQAYAATLAWVTLPQDAVLHLEVAEDYAIAARDALRGVQVRDTAASLTLNNQKVSDTLDAFVGLVALNPGKRVELQYLTTSKLGTERRIADRIEGIGGLEYWRRVAEGADIGPLRKKLLSLNITERVRKFITALDDDGLREQLVRRITWLCGSPALAGQEKNIRDALVLYGASVQVIAQDSEQVMEPLVIAVLQRSTQPLDRQVNRSDFIRLFDERTTLRVRTSDFANIANAVRSSSATAPAFASASSGYARTLLDQALSDDLRRLRNKRFFPSARTLAEARELAAQIETGRLSAASDEARAEALAWCARLSAYDQDRTTPERLSAASKAIHPTEAATIADAFLTAQHGTLEDALGLLAPLNSNEARGAALIIVLNKNGWAAANAWLEASGIALAHLPPDAIARYITKALAEGEWEEGLRLASDLRDDQFDQCPALFGIAALAHTAAVVPSEYRAMLLTGVPFAAESFPLADDTSSQLTRTNAIALFERAAEACDAMGADREKEANEEYAVWLRLRSKETRSDALSLLADRFSEPNVSPRWINLALRFGLAIDQASVVKELDRQTAIRGGMTPEIAVARLAIALANPTPAKVVEEIARFRDGLYHHLSPMAVGHIEIQALVKSGQVARATEVFDELVARGVSDDDRKFLEQFLQGDSSADPASAWIARYEGEHSLGDLQTLVTLLEETQDMERLALYGEALFKETKSIKDAVRVVTAMDNLRRFDELHVFLAKNADLAKQSRPLAERMAWSLFQRGDLEGCRTWLEGIDSKSQNARNLRVSLAIASGRWSDLRAFLENEYTHRSERSPRELIQAARLSVDIGFERGRELLFAGAELGKDDAACLVAAFDTASKAGWDDTWDPLESTCRHASLSIL